jgi:hypothetical protein
MAPKRKAMRRRKKRKSLESASAHEVALAIRAAPRLRLGVEVAALDASNGVGVSGKKFIVIFGGHRHYFAGAKIENLDANRPAWRINLSMRHGERESARPARLNTSDPSHNAAEG